MSLTHGWREILSTLPVRLVTNLPLRRIVNRQVLESQNPADFLFTSGRPGRYNSRGTFCLYAAEDAATAGAEFDRYWAGHLVPQVLYFCRVTGPLLDLESPAAMTALGLGRKDFFVDWRTALTPVATQILGDAMTTQTRFGGIRFPSDAAHERGFSGWNIVLFRQAIIPPATVVVQDDAGDVIQNWPLDPTSKRLV